MSLLREPFLLAILLCVPRTHRFSSSTFPAHRPSPPRFSPPCAFHRRACSTCVSPPRISPSVHTSLTPDASPLHVHRPRPPLFLAPVPRVTPLLPLRIRGYLPPVMRAPSQLQQLRSIIHQKELKDWKISCNSRRALGAQSLVRLTLISLHILPNSNCARF